MSFKKLNALAWSILLICVAITAGNAQTLTIGTALGNPGQNITLPITLESGVDCTALLLRLDYDSSVLEKPSVTAGEILANGQSLDAFSPNPGQLNLIIFGPSELAPFESPAGAVAHLRFRIKSTANPGTTDVALTSAATPELPASGLLDVSGKGLTHNAVKGHVTVEVAASATDWWMFY